MTLQHLIDQLPFVERIHDIMVVQSEISGMYAAVFARDGQSVTLRYETSANYDDFSEGLKSVVLQLRQQGWQGTQAVMLHPAVVTSLITLPIPPKHKLTPQQLAEQVKWEMDPLVTQQLRALSVGQLLVQQGLMTQAQVEEVLAVQHEANASQQRDKVYKKFGEQAQSMHFIKRLPLESTLRRQAWFKTKGDSIHCGWQVQSSTPVEAGFHWLASGVNKTLLRQWQAAFIAAGVKLHGVLPILGNSLGMAGILPHSASKHTLEDAIVVEVHRHQLMLAHVQQRKLMHMQCMQAPQVQALALLSDFVQSLEEGEEHLPVVVIDATGRTEEQTDTWVADMTALLGREVMVHKRLGEYTHAGLLGVARTLMAVKPWLALAEVPVGEPVALWYQRAEFKATLAIAAMLGVVLVAEASVWVRQWWIAREKTSVDVALSKQRAVIAGMQKQIDQIQQLKKQIQTHSEQAERLKNGLRLFEHELPQRNQHLVDLMRAFENAVSDAVAIDSLTEDSKLGFTVNAWALEEAAAQEFAKRVQVNVHDLGFRLKEMTVNQQTGRLGLLGYGIKFNLTKLNDEEWLAVMAARKAALTPTRPANNRSR